MKSYLTRVGFFLAHGFGSGKLPWAPGTFGTLVAIPIYLLIYPFPYPLYAAIVGVMFVVGVWLCQITEQSLGAHDHPSIVWDEIVGYLITMFMAPSGWVWVLAGFVFFRALDIWKPFPIRQIERRVRGGFGNMLDDALAALYAWLVLQGVAYFYLP
ncbi:MAG: phosphatidylglycerophosphatase A [Sulfuricaulis sp.]|uniref:phosphatidylglycerophosphatase A n=1 Tax=Sulfuricaulis sp. TaxID=2003553 RepID=UPI0034A59043